MNTRDFATLAGLVIPNLPRDIPSGYARYLIGNPDILRSKLERALLVPEQRVRMPALQRNREAPRKWQKFDLPWALAIEDKSPESELVMKLHFARRGDIDHPFLGLQHALWLAENQHKVLLNLPPELEIHFPAFTVGDANGRQYMPALLSEPPSQRSYDQGHSWKVDWVPAENFGRGEAYAAVAE